MKSSSRREKFEGDYRDFLYCCDIAAPRCVSSTRRGAGKNHLCLGFTISFGDMVHSKKISNRLLATEYETQEQLQSLKEIARMLSARVKARDLVTKWAIQWNCCGSILWRSARYS